MIQNKTALERLQPCSFAKNQVLSESLYIEIGKYVTLHFRTKSIAPQSFCDEMGKNITYYLVKDKYSPNSLSSMNL